MKCRNVNKISKSNFNLRLCRKNLLFVFPIIVEKEVGITFFFKQMVVLIY